MWRTSSGGKGGRRRPVPPACNSASATASVLHRRCCCPCRLLVVLAGVCAASLAAAAMAQHAGTEVAPPHNLPTLSPPCIVEDPLSLNQTPWSPIHVAPAEVPVVKPGRVQPLRRGHREGTRPEDALPAMGRPSNVSLPSSEMSRIEHSENFFLLEGEVPQGAKSNSSGSHADAQSTKGNGTAGEHVASTGGESVPLTMALPPADMPRPPQPVPSESLGADVPYACSAVSACEPCPMSSTEEECKVTGYRQMVECRQMILQEDETTSTFPNPMSPPVVKEWRSCSLGRSEETVRFVVFEVINLAAAAISTFSVIYRRRQLNQYQYARLSRRINNV